MPQNRIIPSLLLRGGRLVKGEAFRHHRDAGAPPSTARAHNAQGADELVVLDIDANREGRMPDLDVFRAIASEIQIPLTVGGGISDTATARLAMDVGADKITVNSTAIDRPELITELAELFGRQAVVLGIDVLMDDGAGRLFDHRTGMAAGGGDWLAWMLEGVGRGAGKVRLMAVDREGARSGLDLALHARARDAVNVPIILEGGAGTLDHLTEAMAAGADSLALGTMLVFSDNNLVKLKRVLAQAGQPMRP
ncbi:MAG: imidazole glycerol phosphate synthase subunit HisF [Rhodospirillaceae bacterium]|nr:imidazole glycerol phosphate synthase subunit HisF [Rhodospirillaceae bacterium]